MRSGERSRALTHGLTDLHRCATTARHTPPPPADEEEEEEEEEGGRKATFNSVVLEGSRLDHVSVAWEDFNVSPRRREGEFKARIQIGGGWTKLHQ